MARTQEERKAETRTRLLRAAADLFARRGFHAVSTDVVADAAERTSGAVYAHFGTKEGLLLALLQEWENRTAAEMAEGLDETVGLDERLAQLWRTFASPADERGDAWMLLEHELWLYAARNPEATDTLARRYARGRHGMADAFEAWAADDGAELPVRGEPLGALVLALLLGLEMQRRVDPGAVPDALALDALRLMFGRSAEHAT